MERKLEKGMFVVCKTEDGYGITNCRCLCRIVRMRGEGLADVEVIHHLDYPYTKGMVCIEVSLRDFMECPLPVLVIDMLKKDQEQGPHHCFKIGDMLVGTSGVGSDAPYRFTDSNSIVTVVDDEKDIEGKILVKLLHQNDNAKELSAGSNNHFRILPKHFIRIEYDCTTLGHRDGGEDDE